MEALSNGPTRWLATHRLAVWIAILAGLSTVWLGGRRPPAADLEGRVEGGRTESRGEELSTEGAKDVTAVEGPSPGLVGRRLATLDGAPLELPEASEGRRLPRHLEVFYRRRGGEPAWFAPRWLRGLRPTPEVRTLLLRAKEAEETGQVRRGSLAPERVAVALDGLDPEDEARLAEVDAALSWTALHLLSQLAYGPVLPSEAGIVWRVDLRQVDLARALDEALDEGLEDLERRVEPRNPRYRQLQEARDRYVRIVAGGGWPRVSEGEVLKPGDAADPTRLRALRQRLAAEGFLRRARDSEEREGVGSEPVYGLELYRAVARFQATRTLEVDGKLGAKTQQELNVPAAERLAQIEVNLARWRWVPDSVFEDAIVVNIPGYHLWWLVDGKPRLDMEVVVGKPSWPTPVFSDEVEYLVLNPAWNVPASIVRSEVLPAVLRDPGYLAANDMVVLEGWGDAARQVHPMRVHQVTGGRQELRVQQRPGPSNPLGTIKFMLPNELNVYLHDTAAPALFAEADRNLSHGCVRVAKPYELAAELMREEGWSAREVEVRVRRRAQHAVPLPEPVPVHFLYWTAEARPDGTVHFYEDIYGIDRSQQEALGAGS